jgi:hypothetical protein
MKIDQSCLEERQREHVTRMRVERIIELIAAALPELEMRAVAAAAEVWAKVDPPPLLKTIGIVEVAAFAASAAGLLAAITTCPRLTSNGHQRTIP